jgi:NAD(P)-dependent dehydrogenase (short-subunit alcohol dehydrogenase family)
MLENTFSLGGKTVLVTGASSGLGAHFASLAQAAGARVVLAARRVERLQALAETLQENGGEALPVALDVTRRDSVEHAFDQAESHVGVVDVVINNAGIGDPGRFLDMSEQDWQRMLSTNLDGVFHVAQCAAQRLVKAGQPGSIVNIASILGLRVGSGLSHYCTAKAAVVQLTKAMALELARHRIRVNAIAPGYFRTEMNENYFDSEAGQGYFMGQIPMRRLGQLHELNGPLLLLASDAGAFMTGSIVAVDGGHLVNPL